MLVFLALLIVTSAVVLVALVINLFGWWPWLKSAGRAFAGRLLTGFWTVVAAVGRRPRLVDSFAGKPRASEAAALTARQATASAPRFELRGRLAELEVVNEKVARRNWWLAGVLGVGVFFMAALAWASYQAGIGSYARLEDITITRHPSDQGRVEISFRVSAPGRVYYQRGSGDTGTELVDYFRSAGPMRRSWSWIYEPGEPIKVSLVYRGGLWRAKHTQSFPTSRRADFVIVMDTTGSMSRVIEQLKTRCTAFSEHLDKHRLEHRFGLVGFGDTSEPPWIEKYDFTTDVAEFQAHVAGIRRFDGGDLPESALDAVEAALAMFPPVADRSDPDTAIRRVYLVTDAAFHEPSQSGAVARDVARRLEAQGVLLQVFSYQEFADEYQDLLGASGKFHDMEAFGELLSEGRVLED